MTTYILPNKQKIRSGKGFTYKDYQYPNNWRMMDTIVNKLKAKEIVQIVQEAGKDGRLYYNTWDAKGKWTGFEKALEDKPALDDDKKPIIDTRTNKPLINRGLKSQLIDKIKHLQKTTLTLTDHWYIRKADTGEEVPANAQKWRDHIRSQATKMEEAVKKCKSITDIKNLYCRVEVDDKGNKTALGILFDWGELEE